MDYLPIIVNVMSACFFTAELFKLQRKWRARHKMDSTSLEGEVAHTVGNLLAVSVAVLTGAWFAVVFESFLGSCCIIALYWKVKWLIKSRSVCK